MAFFNGQILPGVKAHVTRPVLDGYDKGFADGQLDVIMNVESLKSTVIGNPIEVKDANPITHPLEVQITGDDDELRKYPNKPKNILNAAQIRDFSTWPKPAEVVDGFWWKAFYTGKPSTDFTLSMKSNGFAGFDNISDAGYVIEGASLSPSYSDIYGIARSLNANDRPTVTFGDTGWSAEGQVLDWDVCTTPIYSNMAGSSFKKLTFASWLVEEQRQEIVFDSYKLKMHINPGCTEGRSRISLKYTAPKNGKLILSRTTFEPLANVAPYWSWWDINFYVDIEIQKNGKRLWPAKYKDAAARLTGSGKIQAPDLGPIEVKAGDVISLAFESYGAGVHFTANPHIAYQHERSDDDVIVMLTNEIKSQDVKSLIVYPDAMSTINYTKKTVKSNDDGIVFLQFYKPTQGKLDEFFDLCPELMLEEGSEATDYVPYAEAECYYADSSGVVKGVMSSPYMWLETGTDATINLTYRKDIDIAIQETKN